MATENFFQVSEHACQNIPRRTSLKEQAQRLGKDWQDFLHETLHDAVLRPRREWADRLEEHRESIRKVHGVLPDSTPLIREERDRIG